jgi:hypothetical protein
MRRWVKGKKRNIYHLVINNYYVCNRAIGKIYRKETNMILPSERMCCQNCLREAKKMRYGINEAL